MDEIKNDDQKSRLQSCIKADKIKRDIIKICGGEYENLKYNKNKKKNAINIIKEYLIITLGTISMAIGTSLFLLPNELSTGGFAGVATIIYYFLHLPLGITMLVLNAPLFIMSYLKIGRDLLFKSIYGTLLLATFIDLFDRLEPLTYDKFLACIYGGIFVGIGTAIILKSNASTGGSDLLASIIRKYKPQYRTSNLILFVDTIVITLNVIFFKTIEIGLYSTIAIYLMGKMIDIIFEGTNFTKTLFIISPKYKEIAKEIGEDLNRGSTGIYSRGMYTNDEKMTLLCVGSRTESYIMQSIAKKIDKGAFIIIINAREVLGKGFK